MEITAFRFDHDLVETFIQFGHDLYNDDRNWIPSIRKDLRAQFSSQFSFYRESGNSHQNFLAIDGGRVLGRVSAFVNSNLHEKDGVPVGAIGFFECVEDYAVAKGLLDSAVKWLNSKNLGRIWAPVNFDIWHGYRFMTKGFDQKTFCSEPYNKSYYPDYFGRYGFVAKQLWDSLELNSRGEIEDMIERGLPRYQQLRNRGYRFDPFNIRDHDGEMFKLHSILTKSFAGFLGYTPIAFSDFRALFGQNKYAFHPDLFTFIYDDNQNLGGFAGAFLDVSDGVRLMKGECDLLSKWKFLSARRRVKRIIFHMGGITPEEATKHSGLGRAGFYRVVRNMLDIGYTNVVVALMARGNVVHGLLGGKAGQAQRQYTLYEVVK